jgi:hypothetical protein
MNKLQIIENIFGDNYTPHLSTSKYINGGFFYRAYPRKQFWINSTNLIKTIQKAEKNRARIGVCFQEKCFDIYFTENL